MSTRRQFDDTFKREAVELLLSSERGLSEVARSLGINASVLRRWKKAYQQNGLSEQVRGEQEEIARLRRELSRVCQERDILKKALSIFSRTTSL